jgi:chromate transporter
VATAGHPSILETAWLFLRLGATAFGGPAAHVALMEAEIVRRRRWLSREAFLDYLGVTNLIPGPNSTELAIQIGLARHGWRGLVVAGVAFILPATVIVAVLAWAYVRYGRLPQAAGVLDGVAPVVVAIVALALWRLGRTAIASVRLAVLAALAVAAIVAGVHELIVLAGAGILAAATVPGAAGTRTGAFVLGTGGPASWTIAIGAGTTGAAAFTQGSLFLLFLKIGSVLFGSGYVLFAFLRTDLVERLGWLTEQQLLDAIAVGQVTPGPLFTTATFIGYLLGGMTGAIVATVGIFLPAFVFVALSGPLVPRLRRSRTASAVLDGVNAASLALMAVVTWQLAAVAIRSPVPAVVMVVSVVVLARDRISSMWLIAAGALLGLITAR